MEGRNGEREEGGREGGKVDRHWLFFQSTQIQFPAIAHYHMKLLFQGIQTPSPDFCEHQACT